MKNKKVNGQIWGEGFENPLHYIPLTHKKLYSLPECKKWLKDNYHGWFDCVGVHYVKARGKDMYVRRIQLKLYLNGIRLESDQLTAREFREIVSILIEGIEI